MRGIAAAPNSPLDIMLGLVDPTDPIHNEIASKSKPRQTDTRAAPFAASVMTASAPADGCPGRGRCARAGVPMHEHGSSGSAIPARSGAGDRGFPAGSPVGGRPFRRVRMEGWRGKVHLREPAGPAAGRGDRLVRCWYRL